MDSSSCLKTLNIVTPTVHFRPKASLCRLPYFARVRKKLQFSLFTSSSRLSPLCCRPERGGDGSLPNGVGDAIIEPSRSNLLHVVLVSPQIPGNTGCIARTCAASAVGLHLVEPLGFQVDDTKLKRAGLDYWPYVVVKVHGSWAKFLDYFRQQDGEKRLLALTKRGTITHSALAVGENLANLWQQKLVSTAFHLRDFSYRKGDWLVFGSETCGLPPEALLDCKSEEFGGGTIRIPMVDTWVRCLNLSVSVGIALYEASRQLNYEQLQCPPQTSMKNDKSFVTEDIFA